ncbi:hypothetical protein LMG7141_04129 [Ralstonia condita]|uniref:Inovirus Gp2 family protein n=1 Tax=Ralstonia condita TaxID=3058600 RepID=A0ABM9JT96_9RALS|nr:MULTISPECIES: inovirus Gp2 family protein [Ralstonia]CAJ0802578.1 hypothetical protein LMG7141_04129 [Ralstonia sp. LMG 7141]
MYDNSEDQEALEVIARLDERTNIEETDINGKRTTVIHEGYASLHLFEIEQFVKYIQKGEDGFVDEMTRYSRKWKIRPLYLGKKYYRLVDEWLGHYSDIYHYSARVEVFYAACKELGLLGAYPFSFVGKPEHIVRADGMRNMDVFNILIEKIRARCQTREFKERERLRGENAKRNVRRALALEEAMFSEKTGRSRWLVLSLTLNYKPKFRCEITPEMMQQHRERFFAARDFNKLMSGIKGYVWAIEQGEESGLHLHVILFYSSGFNHDVFIAKQILDYWINTVTQGKGDGWNSNTGWRKKWYAERGHGIGVGQINWDETEKRQALRVNLAYLGKAEQYLMARTTKRIHTFGMGRVPEKKKSGRPRSCGDGSNVGGSSFDVDRFSEAATDETGFELPDGVDETAAD